MMMWWLFVVLSGSMLLQHSSAALRGLSRIKEEKPYLSVTHDAIFTAGTHVFRENSLTLLPLTSAGRNVHTSSSTTPKTMTASSVLSSSTHRQTTTTSADPTSHHAPFRITRKDIEYVGRSHDGQTQLEHEFVVAIAQRNVEALETKLMEVSNPTHPLYGRHWTRQQVVDFTRNDEAVTAVHTFFQGRGATILKTTPGGEYVTIRMALAHVESVFATELHEFRYRGKSLFRGQSYSVPKELHAHVAHVFNLVQFPVPNRVHTIAQRHRDGSAVLINGTTTVGLLSSHYSITSNTGNSLTTQAVYETDEQAMSPSDLSQFQTIFNLPQQAIANDIGGHVYNNACDNEDNCGEANLDIQYIMGVAQGVPTTYYYWGGYDFMLGWITTVVDSPDPPQDVYSISYGGWEGYFSLAYCNSFDTEVMKLGLMGTTIVVAAGDDGALDPELRDDASACYYAPSFPASSPYVVAVGATMGPEEKPAKPEILCSTRSGSLITGGGGFSALYAQPSYQADVVAPYIEEIQADGGSSYAYPGYAVLGRAFPDVSLIGHSYFVVVDGGNGSFDGTSASTPVFGAMVSLVNSKRKAAGKSTMGFINPFLYEYADSFTNDITGGGYNNCSAYGSSGKYNCCPQGFPTVEGWDAATGLGTVNYASFESAAMSYTGNDDQGNSSGDDDSYSVGDSIAIAVAVIVGLGLMAGLCYYVFNIMTNGPLVASQLMA